MPEQTRMPEVDRNDPVTFNLHGCEYRVIQDTVRASLRKPSWWVQRMSDLRMTERHYNHPDGAFSAVYWDRCNWIE